MCACACTCTCVCIVYICTFRYSLPWSAAQQMHIPWDAVVVCCPPLSYSWPIHSIVLCRTVCTCAYTYVHSYLLNGLTHHTCRGCTYVTTVQLNLNVNHTCVFCNSCRVFLKISDVCKHLHDKFMSAAHTEQYIKRNRLPKLVYLYIHNYYINITYIFRLSNWIVFTILRLFMNN